MFLTHEYFMRLALKEASKALEEGEIPIGAVVVCEQLVIAKAHNQVERLQDVTAHAELLAITAAANYLGSKYLQDCTLYVTLEPCAMCAGATFWAQLGNLVYGASSDKTGYNRWEKPSLLHPKVNVLSGVLATECAMLLSNFFRRN